MLSAYINLVINSAFRATDPTENDVHVIIGGYNNSTRSTLFEVSKSKKILPFIGNLMCRINLDKEFWDPVVTRYRTRNQYMLEVLNSVFTSFQTHDVTKVFVYENFGALLASGSDLALFASGDIDLYADPSERISIEKSLADCGFHPKYNNSSRELVASYFYNTDLLEDFHVIVMWQPLSRKKLPFRTDISFCIDWHKTVRYKGSSIILPAYETLAYLCIMHVSVHGYSRAPDIRLYADVHNVSLLSPDWRKVLEYAIHDGHEIRLITVCTIAHQLLAISMPDYILDARLKQKTVGKLLRIVFDRKGNKLNVYPNWQEILKIESYSDNKSIVMGLFNMVFPDSNWIRHYYLFGEGNLIFGYLKHIKSLLGHKDI